MKNPKLGATGNFPRGKLSNDDEGELRLAISTVDKTVRIDFGKPVAWIAFGREDAVQLGEAILARARQI